MFDINQLRTFLAVADTRHFTAAGTALGISQSTVSQHIRRLEAACGRQLFERDTHTVELTADGTVLAELARDIVGLSRQAADYFADSAPRGRVRLGVSDDLTLTRLADLLRDVGRASPNLSVELTVGLTSLLYQKLDAGRLDLVFAKRQPGDDRGTLIHRERLAWLAHREFALCAEEAVPLVLYPNASITSTLAMEALNGARRSWFVACSSETLAGLRAGAQAGLGVMAQSPLLMRAPGSDLVDMGTSGALPPLAEVEFVVLGRSRRLQGAPAALADLIVEKGPGLWA
ncbi:LysR family transcriptional regulator [Nitrospirillum sp. BR 11828]|uniref:LysR family transcriptional regulator n=1 Tax=Nitrospirillum sp. BR 11828 TaxID=3104325 RepID=UPI002ACA65F8|nr:LysR family transcriptional regulator [Nitrospirillum sp. BR 11828]MDZ5648429.1 LysR family transcriptional regulator [Nitrospirillum sp. BR 11828]